ncbi:ATP synthase F1 subunit gamma [Parabacteroides sp. FAFU027]|uniref:ATP synthase F1 subunit gamma n=1 Tax=Parabacteroides sp. FAFU027 TaxID=2922715 RepID=UPI001FAFFC51|nr:ATP synthase F1 subunit gamma [Parabacteroides sp. FAFU027]
MANLKEIRTRIASVKSTQQVTGAMKLVSAAKLRKAQDAIIQIRPYAEKLQGVLAHITQNVEPGMNQKYARRQAVNRVLIIAISSNRGLCGGFNINVVKKTVELLNTTYADHYRRGMVDILAIGKKAADALKARNIRNIKVNTEIYDNLTFSSVTAVATQIMEQYADGTYDQVEMIYNQFKNAAVQKLVVEQFLPVVESDSSVSAHQGMKPVYFFEPSVDEIVNVMFPKALKVQFYKAMTDSFASEHGARMTAMHKATDNAAELIKTLNLTYNKARQASITNEILEIVSGANALNG